MPLCSPRFALALAPLLLACLPVSAQERAPGERVDLGGYRLHYIAAGEGSPTVVFLHGSGDLALLWHPVFEAVAQQARVVAIDEHGMGWSDWGHPANILRQQAFDFERLLRRAGLQPPFVLVGHSRGGLIAGHFTRQFRDQVAGVVLVDSSHPDMLLRYRQSDGGFRWQRVRDRAGDEPVPAVTWEPLPPERQTRSFDVARDTTDLTLGMPEAIVRLVHDRYNRTVIVPHDLRGYFAEELEEMAIHPDDYALGDLPLRVVSAGIRDKEPDDEHTAAELIEESERLQRDLVSLSTRARQIVAEKAGHHVHLDQPEIVVLAILEVLAEARLVNGPRLP